MSTCYYQFNEMDALNDIFEHISTSMQPAEQNEAEQIEEHIESNCYDLDGVKENLNFIKEAYLEQQSPKTRAVAKRVFSKLQENVLSLPADSTTTAVHSRFQAFSKMNLALSNAADSLKSLLPRPLHTLCPLESIAVQNQTALGEFLVTAYHESGLALHEYIAQNPLFAEIRAEMENNAYSKSVEPALDAMTTYLRDFEHILGIKPIPKHRESVPSNYRFADKLDIIAQYVTELNQHIRAEIIGSHDLCALPLQIDTFVVAPNTAADLDLSTLDIIAQSDTVSRRNGAVDAIQDIHRLLRRASPTMRSRGDHIHGGQHFVILVVRENVADSVDDSVYIIRKSAFTASDIEDYSELGYLMRSQGDIIPGFSANATNVLGLTHHIRGADSVSAKVYLSLGAYKSRVFADTVLRRLNVLVSDTKMHRNTKSEFKDQYRDVADSSLNSWSTLGRFWCSVATYSCAQPKWSENGARAMNNIFISKMATKALLAHIDEEFENESKLYYFLDYTVAMQIIEEQTILFKFADNEMILVPTELHREGEMLYAVVVRNDFEKVNDETKVVTKSKQTHKLVDFAHGAISDAIMTSAQLQTKFGIFPQSLPVGARRQNSNYVRAAQMIKVTRELIESTQFDQVKSVQTKGKGHKSSRGGKRAKNRGRSHEQCFNMSAQRFQDLALAALAQFGEAELVTIAQVRFREYQYSLERLLPVWIPECEQLVALAFKHNGSATQVSAIYLDLTDMKNKANLVQMVPAQSWLNRQSAVPAHDIHNLRLHSHMGCEEQNHPQLQLRRPNHPQLRKLDLRQAPALSAPIPERVVEEMPVLRDICSWDSNVSDPMSPTVSEPTSPLAQTLPMIRPMLSQKSRSEPLVRTQCVTPQLTSMVQLGVFMEAQMAHLNYFEQVRQQHATEARSMSVPPPPAMPYQYYPKM